MGKIYFGLVRKVVALKFALSRGSSHLVIRNGSAEIHILFALDVNEALCRNGIGIRVCLGKGVPGNCQDRAGNGSELYGIPIAIGEGATCNSGGTASVDRTEFAGVVMYILEVDVLNGGAITEPERGVAAYFMGVSV